MKEQEATGYIIAKVFIILLLAALILMERFWATMPTEMKAQITSLL